MSIIVKYKFDKSIYADLLPEFNAEFTSDKYNTTDEEVDGIITRTIESDELPTLMRFGSNLGTYVEGSEVALLEILDMNTSGLTSCYQMFRCCKNLTSITCEWNTSNITDMSAMFADCHKLTSLDVSNFDTSNVTTMSFMICNCTNLTTLDLSNFDTSKVTNVSGMFDGCANLTTLDLSNFDTSKVTNMQSMFGNCLKLTTLDVSNFDTSNVTNMAYIFNNTSLLTDIGMLYCNQSTIETITSLLPTNTTQTIWVEDVDAKDLTPVEGVEFKQYAKNTEIMLTSPLLEGDKLVVKDGKLYHYHKMGKVVLDGSEYWDNAGEGDIINGITLYCATYSNGYFGGYCYCDTLKGVVFNNHSDKTDFIMIASNCLVANINKSKLSTQDVNGFKQWLSENPTTVVYELASPYYELISEDPLTISLIAESSDITNSSNIPLNMTINNKGLSTVAMSPSTTYTVAFDKDTDSEVVVNLCGNEVTTTDNIIEITTPSEIDDELIFYGDGVEVSNVRLLEGSVSGDSVPRESFKGLKNSFEDGYIPENLTNINEQLPFNVTFDYDTKARTILKITDFVFKPNTTYTVKIDGTNNSEGTFMVTTDSGEGGGMNIKPSSLPLINKITTNNKVGNLWIYWTTDCGSSRSCTIDSISILEGDWTHLTEEDFNNLGKYKVEYKVTGKNKYPTDSIDNPDLLWKSSGGGTAPILYNSDEQAFYTEGHRQRCLFNLKPNTPYTVSVDIKSDGRSNYYDFLFQNYAENISHPEGLTTEWTRHFITRTTDETGHLSWVAYKYCYWKNIQLEEGTVATEYEPYKEYTKTFYLNSPLLEGDTIEDVNGVATHVKRYGKVVLDGSKSFNISITESEYVRFFASLNHLGISNAKGNSSLLCNNFINVPYVELEQRLCEGVGIKADAVDLGINMLKYKLSELTKNGFNQWLQANPTTVVYQLVSPIYEPISTESILCDSYVNGHLDVDSVVPVVKVDFRCVNLHLKYLQFNTKYIIQFNADNNGVVSYYMNGAWDNNIVVTKGLNKIITNAIDGSLSYNNLDLKGIGFNASNIQVVATDRNADFGYFKGLQSSFENNMENLWDGTLVKGVYISTNYTYTKDGGKARSACIKCKPNTTYIITATNNDRLRIGHISELVGGTSCMISDIDDTNIRYKEFTTTHREGYLIVYVANENNTNENITVDIREKANKVKCKVVGKNKFDGNIISDTYINDSVYNYSMTPHSDFDVIQYKITNLSPISISNKIGSKFQCARVIDESGNLIEGIIQCLGKTSFVYQPKIVNCILQICIINGQFINIQIEEGTQTTSYEPYQEYTKTIYLNSPLLKGDTIEVHNGKLYHYHKMGKVVLDGSEDEGIGYYSTIGNTGRVYASGVKNCKPSGILGQQGFCDTLQFIAHHMNINNEYVNSYTLDKPHVYGSTDGIYIFIETSKLSTTNSAGFKQWLSENPTTVVYELAEPYYEEISPTQEDLIITSVKEGDLHIDTIVPISSKVTYNVNVQLLTDFEQSIVEQVQATQTTDLQSILDEEIDN